MSLDEFYLRRAIRLAMNGRGLVEPNPMVGCVLVKNDRVIGEGYHTQFGHPHAEPNALASCTESPAGATAYVTLEPCCHTNKKTPPCAPRLIAAKVARVVIGCLDPNPDVNGNGIKQLLDAGIEVQSLLLEAECKQLIAPFIARTIRHRPYVIMKWAESADGKIAGPAGRRIQISNQTSSQQVQLLRSRSDSICVGIGTVLNDDPNLTVRGVPILRPLKRLIMDTRLRIPLDSKIVTSASEVETEIFCCSAENRSAKSYELQARGMLVDDLDSIGLLQCPSVDDGPMSISEMLNVEQGANMLVEPGPTLARGFFKQGFVDRLWVIRSPVRIDDDTAPAAATIPDYFVKTGELNLDGDVLSEYLNTQSPAFFAATPSADLVLAGADYFS